MLGDFEELTQVLGQIQNKQRTGEFDKGITKRRTKEKERKEE